MRLPFQSCAGATVSVRTFDPKPEPVCHQDHAFHLDMSSFVRGAVRLGSSNACPLSYGQGRAKKFMSMRFGFEADSRAALMFVLVAAEFRLVRTPRSFFGSLCSWAC